MYRRRDPSNVSFRRAIGATTWDGGLAGAMEDLRLRVEEESVLPDLPDDLGVD